MKALKYLNKINYKLQLEKLVVGVEEPIFIKGIGSVLAKVDSGNGAYNVLHGEDFYYQGDIVVFTTFDEEGNEHKVSKKIQDTITINIGAGHTEERPIVLFDVKFAIDEYINVPFSIGDRSNNKNKVLLGKEFLTKELNALIDISSDNIADQNIQIDLPVKEASEDGTNSFFPQTLKNNPSGAASTIKKINQGVKGGIRGAYNMYRTLGNTNQTLGTAIDNLKKNWSDMMKEIKDYQKSDKYLIFKALNQKYMSIGQPIKPYINNPQIFKILDYAGNNYSGKNSSTDQPIQQDNSSVQNNINDLVLELQNNEKTFERAQKSAAVENKTILYLIIFNAKDVESVQEILIQKYPSYNGSFERMMKDIVNDFKVENTTQLARQIVGDLKEEGIYSDFALVSGIKENRRVRFLTSTLAGISQDSDPVRNNPYTGQGTPFSNNNNNPNIPDGLPEPNDRDGLPKSDSDPYTSDDNPKENDKKEELIVQDPIDEPQKEKQEPPESPEPPIEPKEPEEPKNEVPKEDEDIYPKKAPLDFNPPKNAKKLKSGHYLWKDPKTSIYLEYDPIDNIIYDAIELRRKKPQDENEEDILEWTTSKFILDVLLG